MAANPSSSIQSPKPSLRPPQFRLRTLLLIVTGCAALLALTQWLDPIAVIAIGFLAVSVFFHVAGNAIGTRLRQIGDDPGQSGSPATPAGLGCPRPHEFAPATQLGQRRSLGWLIIVASSVGVTTGAVGGGLWTFVSSRGHADLLNVAVGVIAFAVLGGIAAFMTFGFAQVLLGAMWQAMNVSQASSSEPPERPG